MKEPRSSSRRACSAGDFRAVEAFFSDAMAVRKEICGDGMECLRQGVEFWFRAFGLFETEKRLEMAVAA